MINWGIIGTGKIAYDVGFAIQSIPDCKIIGVSTRNLENAKKYATRLNLKSYFNDTNQLMGLESIDILYISTPNHLHASLIELGLKHGKHILCEKPMTIHAEQLSKLKKLANQKQLFLMEAMWTMFLPSIRQFLDQTQRIGKIRLIQGSMGFILAKERCFHQELGGGSILDLGVYLISLTYALLGKPTEILSQKLNLHGDVETSASISLKYNQDAIAHLLCSFDTQLENSFIVFGEKGSVKLEAPFFRSAIISFQKFYPASHEIDSIKNPFQSFPLLKNGSSWKQRLFHKLNLGQQQKIAAYQGNGYQYQILEVVKCLKNTQLESTILPIDHSIEVLKVIDNINTNKNENKS